MSKPMDNAMKLAKYIYDNYANLAQPSERDVSNLAMLILEHDIETLVVAYERAEKYLEDDPLIECYSGRKLREAILGDIAECKH